MSRHRAVRNLDLEDELAEDNYSDENYDPYGTFVFPAPGSSGEKVRELGNQKLIGDCW